jgi:E3 ubiquitin-protein ligase RNF14
MNYSLSILFFAFILSTQAPTLAAMEKAPSPDDLAESLSTLSLRCKACLICYEQKRSREFVALPCQHEYCEPCLITTMKIGLNDKKLNYLQCPEPRCRQVINVTLCKYVRVIPEIPIDQLRAKEIIYATVKKCPTQECSAVFLATTKNRTVSCEKCDRKYCSMCIEKHAERTSCAKARDEFKRMKDTIREDEEIAQQALSKGWIEKNTKPCPQCKTRIMKAEGCQRVRCTKCQTLFQWN